MLTWLFCMLKDDDFRQFVDKVPRGCKITIVSDCCHSGGLIEATKEQIGDSTNDLGPHNSSSLFHFKNFLHRNMEDQDTIVKNRSLPLSTLTEILKQKSGKDNDIQICQNKTNRQNNCQNNTRNDLNTVCSFKTPGHLNHLPAGDMKNLEKVL